MTKKVQWSKNKTKGATAAGFVALLQGTEGILFSLFGLVFVYAAMTPSFSAADLGAKELICLLLTLIIFGNHAKNAFKSLKTTKGRWYLVSGTATAVGNFCYIVGVATAGSSYGVILTALYPVFSMLLLKLLFKDKQKFIVWIGVAIAVTGGLLFIALPAIVGGGSFGVKQIIGMLIGMFAAVFWAFEGVMIKKGNDTKGNKVDSREVVIIRTMSSTIITWVLIMPLLSIPAGIFQGNEHLNPYHWFKEIFSHWESILIITSTAISVATLRIIHIYAIRKVGPKLTAVIDTNNFWIPAFFNIFLSFTGAMYVTDATHTDVVNLFEPIVWWAWLLMIPIAVGSIMVIVFEKEMVPHKNPVLEKEE